MLNWKRPHLSQPGYRHPLTPESSPHPSPPLGLWDSDDDTIMSWEEKSSRPKSIASSRMSRYETHPPSPPMLSEVLSNTAPPPYTLSAFTAFLSQNHCLETLEYTLAARKYREKYDQAAASHAGYPMNFDSGEIQDLLVDWRRMLDNYLAPGSLREINLPSEERYELLHVPYAVRPPSPSVLDPSVKRMHDLMQESIWVPFLSHVSMSNTPAMPTGPSLSQSYSPTLDEQMWEEKHFSARSGKQSPASSGDFHLSTHSPDLSHQPRARPLSTMSTLSSALHLSHPGSNKPNQHTSHTSVGSSSRDCALTDDSGSFSSPGTSDLCPMTPPTTPPSSEVGLGISHQSPKSRHGSDTWKRVGAKFWARKRSIGGLGPAVED